MGTVFLKEKARATLLQDTPKKEGRQINWALLINQEKKATSMAKKRFYWGQIFRVIDF